MAAPMRTDPLGMLGMVSAMPLAERRFRLVEMLDMFYSMSDDRAAAMMRRVIAAMAMLSDGELLALAEAQTAVPAECPHAARTFLLRAHDTASHEVGQNERDVTSGAMGSALQRLDPEPSRWLMEAMAEIRRAA